MKEYTPSTDDVREDFAFPWSPEQIGDRPARVAAFDRWLAVHDADVLREAATELEQSVHHLDPAHPVELSYINCTRIDARLIRDRANRIEGERS